MKTNIVAHGKFVNFHSSNMDEKKPKWNYLATNVKILVTKEAIHW
jgi:hypothetical protein